MDYSTDRACMLPTLLAAAFLMGVAGAASASGGPAPEGVRPDPADQSRVQRPAPDAKPAPKPAPRGQPLTDRTVRDVKLGPAGELDLGNIHGDIVITASKGPETRIEIVKTARAGTQEADAREMFALVQVEVVERGNRVEVRTHYQPRDGRGGPGRRQVNVAVAYQIAAPAGTRVRAQSVSGSIRSTGVRGESSYETVSGDIRVSAGGRVAAAKSISGSVELSDMDMDSTFQASSASGSITLQRVKARRLEVGSISGEVALDQVDAERIEAQTVSGDVRLTGPLRRDGRIQLRSHSGDVRIVVDGSPGFDVTATTFSGNIRTDLPIDTRTSGPGGPGRGRALRGVHGDGGAVLELTTFSGDITIAK